MTYYELPCKYPQKNLSILHKYPKNIQKINKIYSQNTPKIPEKYIRIPKNTPKIKQNKKYPNSYKKNTKTN